VISTNHSVIAVLRIINRYFVVEDDERLVVNARKVNQRLSVSVKLFKHNVDAVSNQLLRHRVTNN
jgi:hypothetical protein